MCGIVGYVGFDYVAIARHARLIVDRGTAFRKARTDRAAW